MRTWGIDWGTEKNKRAAVALEWSGGRCGVVEVYAHPGNPLTWDATLHVATSGTLVAVDVPFGWPEEFRRFLRAHEDGPDCSLPGTDVGARAWRTGAAGRRRTEQVIAEIHGVTLDPTEFPGLDLGGFAPIFARDEHACDALVAALAARTRALGLTDPPSADDEEIARVEGWIHVPPAEVGWPDLLVDR